MAKKSVVKRPVKKKKPRAVAKKQVKPLSKEDVKLHQRLAQLHVPYDVVGNAATSILFDLEKKHAKPAEVAYLFDAAKKAMTAEVFRSNDPADWIEAARKAAGL